MTAKATAPKRKQIAPTVTTKRIYIGPNTSQMKKYTVIDTDYPIHIKAAVDACPEIDKLCVPIPDLVETEKRAAVKGTLENKYYEAVLAFNKEEK